MEWFIIVYKRLDTEDGYVSGKTYTYHKIKFEELVREKIRAKMYQSRKVAQKKANKLNSSKIYDGEFQVISSVVEVKCK